MRQLCPHNVMRLSHTPIGWEGYRKPQRNGESNGTTTQGGQVQFLGVSHGELTISIECENDRVEVDFAICRIVNVQDENSNKTLR